MTWAFPYIYSMILVTGGTGLVGSHLLAKLMETEKNVRAIYRSVEKLHIPKKIFSYYFQENTDFYFSKIEWVQADITDIPALTAAFLGITHVYHCAGFISFEISEEKKLRKINIEGTTNVVNLCISFQVQKLCHVSSIATLGKSISGNKINEESYFEQTKHNSFYSISKFGAEMEVWRGSQEDLDVIIVNPGIIIGPGVWDSGSGLLFQKVWKGLRFHFPKTTGFIAVEDVVETMLVLMQSSIKNERFVLVAENIDFKTLLQNIAKVLKKPAPSRSLKPWMLTLGWAVHTIGSELFGTKRQLTRSSRKGFFEVSCYDSSKIKEKLGTEFRSVKKSIEKSGAIFLEEKNN